MNWQNNDPRGYNLDYAREKPKKPHIWRWLLLALLVGSILWLTGCTKEEASSDFEPTKADEIEVILLEQKLQRLEEYLGVVEWEEVTEDCYNAGTSDYRDYDEKRCKVETIYTSEKDKVEWVKLGCEKYEPENWPENTTPDRSTETYQRCDFLKSKLGL